MNSKAGSGWNRIGHGRNLRIERLEDRRIPGALDGNLNGALNANATSQVPVVISTPVVSNSSQPVASPAPKVTAPAQPVVVSTPVVSPPATSAAPTTHVNTAPVSKAVVLIPSYFTTPFQVHYGPHAYGEIR
jgi:hypothetical protein